MYVTISGTVTFIEQKVRKKEGKDDQPYRVVTLLGGAPGKKPDLLDVKYFNGTKIEMGQKVTAAVSVMPYMKTGLDGHPIGAAVSLTAEE